MRAIVLTDDGVRFEADHPQPEPSSGEVLVRVLRAGICETDLQLMQGYMGFRGVLGHEFVGVAEEGSFAGKRVVGEINCACDDCDTCRRGLRNHCPNRTVLGILNHDGAFAEYVSVPQANLHRVPDNVSDDVAAFTEPLAAAFQIPAQIPLSEDMHVVVLGDGRLGNLCAQVIRLHGARVTVVGKHRRKLAILDRLGIPTEFVGKLSGERTADVVVDCTGSPTGFQAACQIVRPHGTIVLKTTVADEQTLSLAPLVIDEITVVGSRCGPFDKALKALERDKIDVLSLLDETVPLSQGVLALEKASTGDVLKILLDVGS